MAAVRLGNRVWSSEQDFAKEWVGRVYGWDPKQKKVAIDLKHFAQMAGECGYAPSIDAFIALVEELQARSKTVRKALELEGVKKFGFAFRRRFQPGPTKRKPPIVKTIPRKPRNRPK